MILQSSTTIMKSDAISPHDKETPSKLPTPPDGGARAWAHVFFCHMVFFNTWGVTNSYGVFQQYYTQTLGHAPSDIGWIGGVQMFLLFGGGVFSGRASDAGYFRHCFVAGVFLQVLGMCLTSLCTRYYQIFLSHAVCVGLGNGLLFTPGLSVMSSYFQKKRVVAVGLSAAGAATGGMVYPATVNALLYHSSVGYPWTMRILALIMLVTHIPSIVGYRPYLPPRSVGPLVEWQAFREKPFVFFVASMFFNFWGLYMAFFYLGIFARETIHLTDSLNLLIVLNGVGVIGRTVPNFLSERYIGIMNMTVLISLISALCIYCWAAVSTSAGLYVWAVIYGIAAGGAQALFPAMATRQTTELDKVGTRTGMVLSIVSLACLTAAPIQGALIELDGGKYLAAQLFSASSVIVGVGFLVLSRWSRVGMKFKVKI